MVSASMWTVISVFCFMTLLFLIALYVRKYSIVDVGWGLGFLLVAYLNLSLSDQVTFRQIIVTAMVTVWGLRLAYYVFRRQKGKSEDFRYKKMIEGWGDKIALNAYVRIFLLQGFLLLSVAYPLVLINVFTESGWSFWAPIGIVIWTGGFLCEVIGDYQLRRFVRNEKNEKNRIMNKGLWRYTRHPNYFGEGLLWWGIFFLVLPVKFGILAIFSPIIINLLLLFVSGVPMLEEKYAQDEQYQEYARKTSIFIPWFPKR